MPRGSHPNSRAALERSRTSYPPAPEGNQRRRVHGIYSELPGAYAEFRSAAFFAALAGDSPLTEDPTFVADVALVSGRMERLLDAKKWIDDHRSDFGTDRVQRAVAGEERLYRQVIDGLVRLRMAHSSKEDELAALCDALRGELVQLRAADATPRVVIEYIEAKETPHVDEA